jgi:hypothetical protein
MNCNRMMGKPKVLGCIRFEPGNAVMNSARASSWIVGEPETRRLLAKNRNVTRNVTQ